MSFIVVALLSLLWLVFFLPSLLEARRTSPPYASAPTFQDSLRRLGEAPHPGGRPSPAAVKIARRRETLAVLSAMVVAGAAVGVGFGGWAVWAVVPPVLALAAYVVRLRRDVVRRSARRPAVAADRRRPTAGQPAPPVPVAPVAPVDDDAEIVPSVHRRSAMRTPERMAG